MAECSVSIPFEGSHYHLIRTCPEYRMMCQMEDMRLELEPAWAQPTETHEPIVTQHIRLILDKKALELQNRIVALEEEVKGLRSNKKERKYTII